MKYSHPSAITAQLINQDPMLNHLFCEEKTIEVLIEADPFVALASSIVSQQLSTKVAVIIFNRLQSMFDSHLTPNKIMQANNEDLKVIGLSNQKVKYLKSLSEAILTNAVNLNDLELLSNQEIIDMLVQVKGIGVWTAQMFLMFSCGKEDVFSVKDLGLRNAVKIVYQNPNLTEQEIEDISKRWAPYRSVVSHFLWHHWDNNTK